MRNHTKLKKKKLGLWVMLTEDRWVGFIGNFHWAPWGRGRGGCRRLCRTKGFVRGRRRRLCHLCRATRSLYCIKLIDQLWVVNTWSSTKARNELMNKRSNTFWEPVLSLPRTYREFKASSSLQFVNRPTNQHQFVNRPTKFDTGFFFNHTVCR